jgi:hypothetical protein
VKIAPHEITYARNCGTRSLVRAGKAEASRRTPRWWAPDRRAQREFSEFCYFAEMEIVDLHGWNYHFE